MTARPTGKSDTRRPTRLVGALLLFAASCVVLALALGWRPIKPEPPKTADVSEQSLEQAAQDEARTREGVERGEVILGNP